MLEGKLELKVGGNKNNKARRYRHYTPDVPHSGKAIKKINAIDVFYPVRQDYV